MNNIINLPDCIAFSKHSHVTFTNFSAVLDTLPIKNVSFKSPWYPRWHTVTSTVKCN